MNEGRAPSRNPVLGVIRTARGRADGLAQFGDTVPAFLNSLAPLLAFPIAGAVIEAYRDNWLRALSLLLVTVIAQFAPPVLSQLLAARWKVDDRWLHYATAYNWCYWAVPMVGLLLTFVFAIAVGAGLPILVAQQGVLALLGLYGLWLNWFIARNTLGLGRIRCAVLVVVVNVGTVLLVFIPALLG